MWTWLNLKSSLIKHFQSLKGKHPEHHKPEVKPYIKNSVEILTDKELTQAELVIYGVESEVQNLQTEEDYAKVLRSSFYLDGESTFGKN